MTLNPQKIALQIAYKIHEIATRQGNVPLDTGDLRKAHIVEPIGNDDAVLAANTPYARAVHDGRSAITYKTKKGRRVKQPKRKGNPWLLRAVQDMQSEGLGFLTPQIGEEVADELTQALRKRGLNVSKHKE